ncbi:ATP-binding protein [Bdellovibrio sp. HCB209]|uniref:ATP-binding protein n=1 Tax=Bdellovibrio sp. HCB209 TaxID=3394354 RepID=UPI0039B567BA
MSSNKLLPKVHNLLAFLVLVVTSVVMVGWIVQNSLIIRFFNPASTAMVFNTAFFLSIVALGTLFSNQDYFKISRICGLVVMFFTALSFSQYLFGFDAGMDTFFVKYFEPANTPFPGRMAASTCIALFLLGLAVFFNKATVFCQFIRVTAVAIVCCVGLVGIAGYMFNINSQFGWGSFARMAVHSAVCYITLSIALLWQLRERMARLGYHRRHFQPFYVLIAGIFVTVILAQLLLIKDYQKNRSITEIRADALVENFDAVFNTLTRSLDRMAKRFALNEYRTRGSWEIDAASDLNDFKGIRRISWTDGSMVYRWVYPMNNGGEKLVGMKVAQQIGTVGVVEKAIQMRQPLLSDVVELRTGGDGVLLYYPVFGEDKLLGVIAIALEAQSFFAHVAKAPGYFVEIKDDDGHELLNTGNAGIIYGRDWGYKISYKAFNANWDFQVTPMPNVVQGNSSYLPGVICLFGVSVSILLAISMVFYNRSRESERRLRESFDWQKAGRDSISLMLLQLDQMGNISSINRATEELLGYQEHELIGKQVFLLSDYSEVMTYRGRLEEKLQRSVSMGSEYLEGLFESGDAPSYERLFVSKSGRHYNVALSLHRVINDHKEITGYLVVGEDVTQKKERERILKEREEKVLISSRLATLGEMAAGIAHEINNPLAVMGGYISMIRKTIANKGMGGDIDLNRRIDSMESMVGRIAKIVRGLRSYAHESVLDDMEEVELAVIVDDTLAFCHEKFKQSGIQLIANIEPGVTVKCRPYQISQVILNLLNNAFDAVEKAPIRRVKITAAYAINGVEISVSDSGPGVQPELRERIMQPFFTTKEVGKGVGLGLSISMGIIQSHNGKFFLDNDSQETKFTIWLPNVPHQST